jgi:hypothetical protein
VGSGAEANTLSEHEAILNKSSWFAERGAAFKVKYFTLSFNYPLKLRHHASATSTCPTTISTLSVQYLSILRTTLQFRCQTTKTLLSFATRVLTSPKISVSQRSNHLSPPRFTAPYLPPRVRSRTLTMYTKRPDQKTRPSESQSLLPRLR